MADWSIQIVPKATPGSTLYADAGDAVSGDNRTTQNHQPLQTQPNGLLAPLTLGSLLWDPVTRGHQTPAWVVAGAKGTVINYTCLLHGLESGTITVT